MLKRKYIVIRRRPLLSIHEPGLLQPGSKQKQRQDKPRQKKGGDKETGTDKREDPDRHGLFGIGE
jgi:hypothetical protein